MWKYIEQDINYPKWLEDGTIPCISDASIINDAYAKNGVDNDVVVEVGIQYKNVGHRFKGMLKWKK